MWKRFWKMSWKLIKKKFVARGNLRAAKQNQGDVRGQKLKWKG